MTREYFCGGCGLFHWTGIYQADDSKITRVPYEGCPNTECISHTEKDVAVFAVDTTTYAYFADSNEDFINKVKWSSARFAPEWAIETYIKQGIPIR